MIGVANFRADVQKIDRRTWDSRFSSYEIGFVDEDYLLEMASSKNKLSEPNIKERLAKGHRCFAVVRDRGVIASYTWCDFNECNHSPYSFKLNENEVYLYDAFTPEEYRGHNIAPYTRYCCYQALEEMSKEVFYSVSEYFNTPAVRFKQKLNARFLKLCLHVTLGQRYARNWTLKEYQKPTIPINR